VTRARNYVLGESAHAARRLEIQDAHLADASERLLDELAVRPQDRVVELGCGPGGFSKRIIRRLGKGGVLISVDSSAGLLAQARERLSDSGPGQFAPILADIDELGSWLEGGQRGGRAGGTAPHPNG
jgi:trans-aconitate methyltransferase